MFLQVFVAKQLLNWRKLGQDIVNVKILSYESNTLLLLFADSYQRLKLQGFFLLLAHEKLRVVSDVKSSQTSKFVKYAQIF
jgi:hypothetical protein